ncbi:MAG: PA14 domain-containing protein, partial [Promethearchaeia archaeon]
MWIDNLIVLDQWTSLQSTTLQSADAFEFQDINEPYSLELEYRQYTGNYSLQLLWGVFSNSSNSTIFDAIPSSRLFSILHFGASPYDAFAASSTELGRYSTVGGIYLTLGTAGQQSSFVITSRDLYGNVLQACEKRHVISIVPVSTSTYSPATALNNSTLEPREIQFSEQGTCSASYLLTVSGTYSMMLFQAYTGSLAATYYQQVDFTEPTSSPPSGVSNVNLCPSTRCPSRPTSSALAKYQPFSLRFEGLIWPGYAGTYTFLAEVENSDDRVKLWVGNSLLIDAWESLPSLEPSGIYVFQTGKEFEDIKIEYKTTETCVYPYYCYDLKLKWDSIVLPGSSAVIPSANLLQRSDLSNVPVDLRITPAIVNAKMSTASGLGLSFGTAGVASKFTVTARDAYSNVVGQGGAFYIATSPRLSETLQASSAPPLSLKPDVSITTPQNSSSYPLQVTFSKTGDQQVHVQSAATGGVDAVVFDNNHFLGTPIKQLVLSRLQMTRGADVLPRAFSVRWTGFVRPRVFTNAGLWATYYSTPAGGNESYPVATGASHFLSYGDELFPGPSCSNGSYRIEWAGMLRPSRAQQYRIHAARQTSNERIKVWVDNVLLIDM